MALLRVLLFLQMNMDYENLSNILIKNKQIDVLFELFKRKELKKKNLAIAILAAFKESLRMDE